MVLQRGQKVPVWGTAKPHANVMVEFAGQKQTAVADATGNWKLSLKPLKASKKGRPLVIRSGRQSRVIREVLVGEVWLCSGQSNMEWPVRRSLNPARTIASARHPTLRLYKTPHAHSATPVNKINSRWVPCTPANVTNFSAVAYHFGRKLQQELDVPVGLLLSAWGGTRIEPWTPPCGFEGIPSLKSINDMVQAASPSSPIYQKKLDTYLAAMRKWLVQAEACKAAGQPIPPLPAPMTGLTLDKSHQTATKLYNGMIHAHVPFAIKGAIWYQGESNYREGHLYTDKTRALVQGWRKLWGYDFPYYFVQIAPFKYGSDAPEKLAEFWEAQANIVKEIPKTGMVVISDVTTLNDIHPPNKHVPGTRLALHALSKDYGKKGIVCTGPVFKKMDRKGNILRLSFSAAEGLTTLDGKSPNWFEVAGADGVFHKAIARINGHDVLVSSAQVSKPLVVRFAWHKLATPNLTNKSGIPAQTFRAGKLPPPKNPAASVIDAAKDYHVIYQINLPSNADYSRARPHYLIDNSASYQKQFSRLAYYLELERQDGKKDYVYAAMDPFTQNLQEIGIPTAHTRAKFMQKVNRLTVRSNVRGVEKLTHSGSGSIEFWSGNYSPENSSQIPNASAAIFDFGDTATQPAVGYGCMQIHHWKSKTTVMALNRWGSKGVLDVGIGNSPGKTRDWTFTGSATNYRRITLVVMVK